MRVTELCEREKEEEAEGVETAAAGGRLGSFGTNNNYNNNSGSGVGVGVGVGDEGKYVVHAPTIITTITVTT